MRKLAVLCIGLLGLTLLVGCGADDAKKSAPPGRPATYATEAPAPAAVPPPALRDQGPARKDNTGSGETTSARKEIVTGSVEITADKPIDAAGKIADRVREVGGRIDSRTEQPGAGDTDASATLTVRVPADKTDAFIDGLGGIGKVTRVSTNRDDVTMQWEDLDARIKALQASVERLRGLIANATNTADLLNAEQALSSRQGELDSLTAQKRHLDDQVALSSLSIDITTTTKKVDEERADSFWEGIVDGWNSLVDWLKDAVVFTGKAIPWLGFLVVLAAVVWGIVRTVLRRKKTGASGPEHGEAGRPAPVTVGAERSGGAAGSASSPGAEGTSGSSGTPRAGGSSGTGSASGASGSSGGGSSSGTGKPSGTENPPGTGSSAESES
ncbi:DUF4349 domain-containing protein [Nocardia brasiliensis]|uniref:DUF4349 domain-containing protein n=1 Tax=Nocardia brasiliensis TaxID=37326 RepID=UPI0024551DA2|nr:DUF4349 domain-containing protein [Nocardia brasiliensis]